MIVNQLVSISKQDAIFIKEIQKHCCCDSFVAIGKAVILCYEIQKVCCFFFQCRVDILPRKALVDITDATLKGIILLIAKQIGISRKFHTVNNLSAFFIG